MSAVDGVTYRIAGELQCGRGGATEMRAGPGLITPAASRLQCGRGGATEMSADRGRRRQMPRPSFNAAVAEPRK